MPTLALINTNRIKPPIAPVGLEYVGGAARRAGIGVRVIDLCLADDPDAALRDYFAASRPDLVGLTFRNVDDCFWPSAQSFVPDLCETVRKVRGLTDAPVLLGGVGFSMFPERILDETGADFGIHGDGEEPVVLLVKELAGSRCFERVPGLLWRQDGHIRRNPPAWPTRITVPASRDLLDNPAYFRLGGQLGVETKRGCTRPCIYCADPLAKGSRARSRMPAEVADEIEALLAQGVDVLHLCDSEFNTPREHALAVCEELVRRILARRVRWYTYMAVVPFDAELADAMRRAGCVGINFTADSGSPEMLRTYRQPHAPEDIAAAARLCRENGIAVMFDLLLGGPGETPRTLRETIEFMKRAEPDCVGAQLGVRVYPGTVMAQTVAAEGLFATARSPLTDSPPAKAANHPSPARRMAGGLRRRYAGPVDFFRPTFYISSALGPHPARLVRELIAGDARFFEPIEEGAARDGDYNYNDNTPLVEAIAAGQRGAYWDILRRLRAR